MPHAVSSLPSIANSTGPYGRRLPDLSSNSDSRSFSDSRSRPWPYKLDRDLVRGILRVHRVDIELAQGGHALDRATRTVAGEIGIKEVFESKRANACQVVRAAKMRRPFCRRVTGRANRTVGVVIEALTVLALVAAFENYSGWSFSPSLLWPFAPPSRGRVAHAFFWSRIWRRRSARFICSCGV